VTRHPISPSWREKIFLPDFNLAIFLGGKDVTPTCLAVAAAAALPPPPIQHNKLPLLLPLPSCLPCCRAATLLPLPPQLPSFSLSLSSLLMLLFPLPLPQPLLLNVKHYLINYPYLFVMSRHFFVFFSIKGQSNCTRAM
jgi:hypothetical protein